MRPADGKCFVPRSRQGQVVGPLRRHDGSAVAFLDVTVLPMDCERLLPHQTVVVAGERIVAVGPVEEIPVPAQATRIHGRGAYLLPGLADMHVHLGEDVAPVLFLANGVTTVRNMWGGASHLKLRDRIARAELLGPTVITSGPILDGAPSRYTVVATADEATRAVAAQHADGYDFVKVYNNLEPVAYDAILAAAARYGMPVAGHVPRPVGLPRVLASGQRSIEHLRGYVSPTGRGNLPDEDAVPGLAALTRDAGVWNCPTLVLREHQVPEQVERLNTCPEARFLPPRLLARWRASWAEDRTRASAADWARMREANRRRQQLVKAFHDTGARLLLGTDAPNPGVLPGFAVHDELRQFVEAGLTPYAALRAGTADAAEFLGAAGEFGVVATGARADLLLLEGNPLADLRHAARPLGVMVGGRWLPRQDLEGFLDDLATSIAGPNP
jgi:imidazolonepropionase-like amidohydrolase